MLSVHLNAQILQHYDLWFSFFFFFCIQALSVKATSGWVPHLDKR